MKIESERAGEAIAKAGDIILRGQLPNARHQTAQSTCKAPHRTS